MTITAHIIDTDDGFTEHVVESGESLAVAGDQRVHLPEITSTDATLAIDDGDVLSVSSGGETLLLPSLLANIEAESGSALIFADSTAVESLGDLLARTSLTEATNDTAETVGEMADLVHDDADGGDLFYLNDLVAAHGALAPAQVGAGEVLELGELVEFGGEQDALFGAPGDSGDQVGAFEQTNDV